MCWLHKTALLQYMVLYGTSYKDSTIFRQRTLQPVHLMGEEINSRKKSVNADQICSCQGSKQLSFTDSGYIYEDAIIIRCFCAGD